MSERPSEHETDFCVVGGGPAGMTMAVLLAKSGARVVLVERSPSMERLYRGEILQTGAMTVLAQLGVLDGACRRGCYEHGRFRLLDRDKTLISINYRQLDSPYNCLLSLPQQHLLAELREAAERLGVVCVDGHRVGDLLWDNHRIVGVVAGRDEERMRIRAHCVVAADGRYSNTRRLAGIEYDRVNAFDHDILWFRLPYPDDVPEEVRIFRAGGNPMIAYHSHPDKLQLGWTLPHNGFKPMAARGLDHIKAEIARAVPNHAELVHAHINDRADISLLDVFAGAARSWVADGLLLIGDAAHTHAPIGAQGINLAVQDAVVAHPILMASLEEKDASAEFLSQFPQRRQPDIVKAMKLQKMMGKAMLKQGPIVDVVRPTLARLLEPTPIYRHVLRRLALGNENIQLHTPLFVRD